LLLCSVSISFHFSSIFNKKNSNLNGFQLWTFFIFVWIQYIFMFQIFLKLKFVENQNWFIVQICSNSKFIQNSNLTMNKFQTFTSFKFWKIKKIKK
jgi:hypothetical protein